jgi:uncharacterized membrane protein SirB2
MQGSKRIFLVFKFFMVLIYISLGVLMLFSDVLPLPPHMVWRPFFGVLFIVYGIYRTYTIYKSFIEIDDEQE